MKPIKLTMKLSDEKYSVCQLDNYNPIPIWALQGDFFSITKTEDELSIVCLQKNVPDDIRCEKNWRMFKVEGPLDFSLVGILASISNLMAEAQISIFALSTYDTDYILVKENNIDSAISTLIKHNYNVIK